MFVRANIMESFVRKSKSLQSTVHAKEDLLEMNTTRSDSEYK